MPCETGALCEAGAGLEADEFGVSEFWGGRFWGRAVFAFCHKVVGTEADWLRRGKNAVWITDFAGFKPELSTERLFYIRGVFSRGVMKP